MAYHAFNLLDTLNPPPFVTTLVDCKKSSVALKSWSTLRKKLKVEDQSKILEGEVGLLTGFIGRKGTQLRLEKALMLSNRILKLGKRWSGNKFVKEFTTFDEGLELSVKKEEIRLPSRQWSNWIIYLTLRNVLILAKIKYECERTVKYWLGLISSSHHATDSLVAVGILSRMWYVSSTMVESLINVMYPTVCKLSIHLEPTKAENWLSDLEVPSKENLGSWIAEILGAPFIPARLRFVVFPSTNSLNTANWWYLSKGWNTISQGIATLNQFTMDYGAYSSKCSNKRESTAGDSQGTFLIASEIEEKTKGSDEEDFGVPVIFPSSSKSRGKKKQKLEQITLNERWTRFFSCHKSKLKKENGKKQFCVRIKKYIREESDKKIVIRLKKLRRCIKSCSYQDIILMINQFQKFLSRHVLS